MESSSPTLQRAHGATPGLRVLMVIPGVEADRSVMIFARREADALEREGINVRRFFLSTRTSPLGIRRGHEALQQSVNDFAPDIVHAQFGTVTGLVCSWQTAPRFVVTFRGSDLNPYFLDWRRNLRTNFLRHRLARSFSHIAAARADGIVCVSEQLRSRLSARSRSRAIVLPAAINTCTFAPIVRADARQTLGWGDEERIVLFSANRTPAIKRPELAQAAVEIAARRLSDVRLVTMNGHVDPQDVPLYMNGADALLLTSDFEGAPTVVTEALACNLPVVSVDVGDVADRLRGVLHSVVAERTPNALGNALVDVLVEPMRSNGRLVVEHSLDDRLLARELIAFYHLTLARRRR